LYLFIIRGHALFIIASYFFPILVDINPSSGSITTFDEDFQNDTYNSYHSNDKVSLLPIAGAVVGGRYDGVSGIWI
jgi:hypothetical protein